jgi:hypothetical protein
MQRRKLRVFSFVLFVYFVDKMSCRQLLCSVLILAIRVCRDFSQPLKVSARSFSPVTPARKFLRVLHFVLFVYFVDKMSRRQLLRGVLILSIRICRDFSKSLKVSQFLTESLPSEIALLSFNHTRRRQRRCSKEVQPMRSGRAT